ncbi:MAG: tetratricopeptide repeat protein [Velocimicrobium sp.]
MVADLDFMDDTDGLTEKERFRKHFRFLKFLKEDTLLVIDNFDTTASTESLLSQFCDLKCKVIFTTRNQFSSYETFTITADKKQAEQVLQSNLGTSTDHSLEELELILEFLNYHTMAVELVAKLLSYTSITPAKLLYQWYGTCVNEVNELLELGFLTLEHNQIQLHPYIRKIINARKSLSLNDCPQLFEHLRATCVNEINSYHGFALDMVDTTLRFVEKDNEDIWKRIVFAALKRNSQYQQFRSFEKLLNECNDICQHYHNISAENSAMLLHFQAVKAAKIHQNFIQALELEEKAIFLATKYGTSQILNLSSMYLDAGRYLALLGKQEKALDYTKKAAGVLSNTQMQYSTAGIFTLTSYAKLLYESGKISDAIQIYSNCISLVNKVYGDNSITKGYLTQNLAAICASAGNNKMAMLYYSQAENILRQYLEEENPDLIMCAEQKAMIERGIVDRPIPLALPFDNIEASIFIA